MIPILLEKWYLIIFYCTTETTFLFCFYWFDLLFSFSQSGHIVFWFNLKKAWQQLVLSYVCWTNIILFWVAFLLIISTGFFFNPWSANPTKWSRHSQTNCRLLPTNCLSVLDNFVGLALKGLRSIIIWLVHFSITEFTSAWFLKWPK